nr:hypothetical protein [uncultured Devosia sp.]
MLRIVVPAILALLLLGMAPQVAFAEQLKSSVLSPSEAEIALATRLTVLGHFQLQNGEIDAAFKTLLQASSAPGFLGIPREYQFAVAQMIGTIEMRRNATGAAYDRLSASANLFPELVGAEQWALLAVLAAVNGDGVGAVEAMEQLLALDAGGANWEYGLLAEVLRSSRGNDAVADRRYRLMTAVWSERAAIPSDYDRPDSVWYELLIEHLNRGQDEPARAVAAALTQPDLIASLYFAKQFKDISNGEPISTFRSAQETELLRARMLVANHPRDIRAITLLVTSMMAGGNLAEALDLADTSLAAAEDRSVPTFDDVDGYLHWLHDIRSRILFRLGRYDEALLSQTMALETSVTDSISHQVNLGMMNVLHGQPKAALAALATKGAAAEMEPLDGANPYGLISAEHVKACAYSQLGDTDALSGALTYLIAHIDVSYRMVQSALICADRVDAIVPLLVAQLENPDTRVEALAALQRFEMVPNPTPIERLHYERLEALRRLPLVREAVDKYGTIRSWPAMGGEAGTGLL